MSINLQITEFKARIYKTISESGMPTEITRLVLGEVLKEVSHANAQIIKQEIEELKAEAKKEAETEVNKDGEE